MNILAEVTTWPEVADSFVLALFIIAVLWILTR